LLGLNICVYVPACRFADLRANMSTIDVREIRILGQAGLRLRVNRGRGTPSSAANRIAKPYTILLIARNQDTRGSSQARHKLCNFNTGG